jgi:predicted MPP superfamily phosphohydrolase
LLAHDPRLFAWVPDGRFDLVLSGHTHGGQVGTDMFGVPWSVLRLFGVYDQGAFRRGATHLWVHRGNWHTGLPPRMGIATEVVVHVLA